MKRRMGFLEASMYAGADTPVNVVFPVKTEGRWKEEDIRSALNKIQQKHPFLHVVIEMDADGIPWYATSETILPIPLRIAQRHSDEDWITEADYEWAMPFDAPHAPLARVVWIRSETVSELLIVCHHCISDATSIVAITRELLECLADPDIKLHPYQPFSPEAFVSDSIRKNAFNRLAATAIAGITRLFLLAVSRMKEVRKGRFYTIRWKLNEEETSTLLSVCKEKDINLNAALILVFMRAFELARHVRTSGRMFASVDMRRFLTEIKKDHLFAFPSMVGLSTPKDNGDFREQANALRDRLYQQISATNAPKMLFFTEYLLPLYPRSIKYAKAGKGGHDFAFANIGRIPLSTTYGNLKVTEVYSPFSRFPMGNPSKVSVSTFNGQMDFAFTSEEGYLTYRDGKDITETAMVLLRQHLSETKPVTIPD